MTWCRPPRSRGPPTRSPDSPQLAADLGRAGSRSSSLGRSPVAPLAAGPARRAPALDVVRSGPARERLPRTRRADGAGSLVPAAALTAARRGRRWHRLDVDTGGDLARARRGADGAGRRRARRVEAICSTPRRADEAGRLLVGSDLRAARSVRSRSRARAEVRTRSSSARPARARPSPRPGSPNAPIEPGLAASSSTRRATRSCARRCARRAQRRARVRRVDARGAAAPTTRSRTGGDRDRRQGARRRALHRARTTSARPSATSATSVRVLRGAGMTISLADDRASSRPARARGDGPPARARTTAQPVFDYLDSLTARQARDLAGARDRLAVLAESDAGRWLDPGAGRGRVRAARRRP